MMATDLIRYDLLVQEALKSVVKRVLEDAKRDGLPGEHYFYITFRTKSAGVRLSDRMRERYPDEMTVVLQHQFWELGVNENGFEVGLSFSGVPERLLVPFSAMTGFFDPSVPFSVKFEVQEKPEDAVVDAPAHKALAVIAPQRLPSLVSQQTVPAERADAGANPPQASGNDDAQDTDTDDEPERADTKVVSIDAFRKKP